MEIGEIVEITSNLAPTSKVELLEMVEIISDLPPTPMVEMVEITFGLAP